MADFHSLKIKTHALSLKEVFDPTSIAVIGASDKPNSVGMKVFKNLLQGKFIGKLYAVNPKHKYIQGQPSYTSVKKINDQVDLVIITTPAKVVSRVLKECGEKGVRAVIIISSGFSETGQAGKTREQKLLTIAKKYSIISQQWRNSKGCLIFYGKIWESSMR